MALALAGMIVFGPGPDQPLHRPLMSSVGRAETRSRMVKFASPQTAGTPVAALKLLVAQRGLGDHLALVRPVSGTTSS